VVPLGRFVLLRARERAAVRAEVYSDYWNPPGLLRAFSTRRVEIERHLERSGHTSRRTREVAALATRGPRSAFSVTL
jgi:hypothetical protein